MRVLVTGGAGFIGSHLVEHYHQQAEVRVLDDFASGHAGNLEGLKVEVHRGSITDRKVVAAAMRGVDYVFHLAAMVSVPESMQQPVACAEANVIGLLNVLEEAAAAGVKKLCFSSSAAIYGDNPTTPKVETLSPDPQSPYAVTKLDGEYYCRMFTSTQRLPTACLRYFNVFGPRQDPGSAYAAAVPIFIHRALSGKPLMIHGDGGQTRDFVYVKDVVAANVFAAANPQVSGVFNVGYGRQLSILKLARQIIAAVDSRSAIEHTAVRPGDVRHSCASVEKLRAAGFAPTGTLEEGLRATIDSFRQRRASRDA